MIYETSQGPMTAEQIGFLLTYSSYRAQRLSGISSERLAPYFVDAGKHEERYREEMRLG